MIRNSGSFDTIENLEPRTLLAATPPGTVLVRGTNTGDIISLDVRRASDGSKELKAIINGTVQRFNLTGITTIQVDALGGDDRVFVDKNVLRPMLINGGLGDDQIIAGAGDDRLIGGREQDTLTGNDGNDNLRGNDGSDLLQGNDGNDSIDGGAGSDFVRGGNGNDNLTGGAGTDQMFGESGNDRFFARDGDLDTLSGGDGDNTLVTSDANDAAAQI